MNNTQVYELLISKGNNVRVSGRDYVITCLNPEHDDSNPSLRVDQVTGIYNCPSCGFKGNIFKYYNIFSNSVLLKITILKEKIAKVKTMTTGLDFPVCTPYTRSFRGISAETLKYFEAFTTTSIERLEDRICFPIRNVLGKIQVFVGRHLLSNANPRYLNYPAHSQVPMFPPTLPKNSTSMILVEGIFDMLNLYDNGVTNSVCVFGTQTLLSDTANKLLPYKVQGVTKIYILFDGDLPGTKAATQLKPLLEKCEFTVEILYLEDDKDPGILNKEEIDSINSYIKEKSVLL